MAENCGIEHHPQGEIPGEHVHSDGHGHSHRPASYHRVKIVLFISLGVLAAQSLGSWLSGSLSLLADTIHVASDSFALLMTLIAGQLAQRPQSARRSFGYYRLEILSALVNGLLLFFVAAWILREAYERWQSPHEIEANIMLGFSIGGLILNLAMLAILHPSKSQSLNLKGAYLHILGDSMSSALVIAAAYLIRLTGLPWIDALASCLVALMIIWMSGRLILQSVHVLLEGTPLHLNATEVEENLKKTFPQIIHIHDFHLWEITSNLPSLSAHLEVKLKDLSEYSNLLQSLSKFMKENYGVGHSTFQLELRL